MNIIASAPAPVETDTECHAIHTYFNTSPESPDGKRVTYFRTRDPEGHIGEVVFRERSGGDATVVGSDIEAEDAHRVACQQWALGGNALIYHRFRSDNCRVEMYELTNRRGRVLADDRLLGWTNTVGNVVPLYAPHWRIAGPHDLELLDVEGGKIETVLTADEVRRAFPDWVETQFGNGPIAIFLPALSPDGSKVFFKLAQPKGGHYRSNDASKREGLFIFDLAQNKLISMFERWGHPAWSPDSRHLINVPTTVQDPVSGTQRQIPALPQFPGSHPSYSPDGTKIVTDTRLTGFGGTDTEWGIVVASVDGTAYEILHRFDNRGGASSWRPPHPHPVFSPDGERIYFNMNSPKWTRLHVLDFGKPRSA